MGEKSGTGRGEGNLWMVAVPRFFRRSKKTSAAVRITPTQEAVMTVKDVKQKDFMSANFLGSRYSPKGGDRDAMEAYVLVVSTAAWELCMVLVVDVVP